MNGRELTIASVIHPAFLEDGVWQLVDHPVLDPLSQGDPTCGWEGDNRLAVYLHPKTATFTLWRLEHDNVYRPVAQLPSGASLTNENVNRLCRKLVEQDTRKGFDPYKFVIGIADQAVLDAENVRHDAIIDFADKLHFGLAHSHMPGIDVTRPRQVISKR